MFMLRHNLSQSRPAIAQWMPRLAFSTQNITRECYIERLTGQDEGISVLKLNRPASKNALGRTMLQELSACLSELRFDISTRVVLLQSAVPGVFCAGADLKERATMDERQVAEFVHQLRATFTQLERLPMPTIAAVDGAALGGGLELALCCDMRTAGPKALLGLPETSLAIIPGAGGTQRLSRLAGGSTAKYLIFTAKRMTADEAVKYGVVTQQATSAWDAALGLAREILPKGPVALRMAKMAVDRGLEVDSDSGMAIEQLCYAQVIPTQDRLEGLRAFKEKRAPKYTGK